MARTKWCYGMCSYFFEDFLVVALLFALGCFADVRLRNSGFCSAGGATYMVCFIGLSAFFVVGFALLVVSSPMTGSELLRIFIEDRLRNFGIAGTATLRPPPCTMAAFSKSMLPPHEAAVVVGPHICIPNVSLWFTTNESSVESMYEGSRAG